MAETEKDAEKKRYRIERQINIGGHSLIILGYDTQEDRQVAFKVLAPAHSRGVRLDSFFHEMNVLGMFDHPNIIKCYGFYEFSLKEKGGNAVSCPSSILEYFKGDDLSEILDFSERFRFLGHSFDENTKIILGIAKTLHYAHRCGVIHKDIKPSNVLSSGSEIKVIDWELAYCLDGRNPSVKEGTVAGTPGFLSPEACRGNEPDPLFDVYSLGVVGYCLYSGQIDPFDGLSKHEIIMRTVEDKPEENFNLKLVPKELRGLIHDMLREEEIRIEMPSVIDKLEKVLG
ncbi:MAG: serine/threonine protein kinase [Nanoarchaeota archaeon]|nr:serine/threonine protein kinase [Nanoarchaeota archaeon]